MRLLSQLERENYFVERSNKKDVYNKWRIFNLVFVKIKQKNLKWILKSSLLMTENRLKTYIKTLAIETSCKEFIDVNTKILNEIKNDTKVINQLKIHRALSNLKRFLIIKILEIKPMCTCALAKLFDATDGAITHHLKILEDAGLIIGKKQGYYTIYYTKESLIEEIKL